MLKQGVSLIQQIKDANRGWFTPENKRFFGDVDYYGLYGKKTHNAYLVQATNKWSDMFGKPKKISYVIKYVDQDTLKIVDNMEELDTLDDVKEWMEEN